VKIKAIPTTYRGVDFDSTLEADWAATFDGLGWKWEPEPVGVELDDGQWYRPDFYLPTQRVWAEVKGPHNQRIDKPSRLQAAISRDSFDWDADLVVILRPPRLGRNGIGERAWWENAIDGQDIVIVLCPECDHYGFMDLAGTWSCRRHMRVTPEPNKFWTAPNSGLYRPGDLAFERAPRERRGPQHISEFLNDITVKGGKLVARIRTLKPTRFTSRSLAKCPRDARTTFEGMWCEADDHGRGIADARLLKGAIWPLDDDITFLHVSAHVDVLAATGHIRLYEVDGEAYYEVSNWAKHQAAAYRRGEPKYPPFSAGQPLTHISAHGSVQEDAARTQMAAGTGNREQGEGKQISRSAEPTEVFEDFELATEELTDATYEIGSDDDPDFCEFWSTVPKKDGKAEARVAWANHVLGKGTYKGAKITKTDPDVMIAGMRSYAERVRSEGTERRHIKMAEGWINGRRWEDELARNDETPEQRGVDIWR